MDENSLAAKFQELFLSIENVLSRPEIAALISPEASEQLVQIRNFARSWDEHAAHLTSQQKAQCFDQLSHAVRALTQIVAEFDQIRLKTMPVEQMGKA